MRRRASEAATARDALATAETQDERQQALLKSGVVPQATADDSALKLQQARGALAQAESRVLSAKAALAGDPEIATDRAPGGARGAGGAARGGARPRAYHGAGRRRTGWSARPSRLQQGQYVTPAVPVLALVADRQHLDRGQLQGDRPHPHAGGQRVDVVLDTYPDRR